MPLVEYLPVIEMAEPRMMVSPSTLACAGPGQPKHQNGGAGQQQGSRFKKLKHDSPPFVRVTSEMRSYCDRGGRFWLSIMAPCRLSRRTPGSHILPWVLQRTRLTTS